MISFAFSLAAANIIFVSERVRIFESTIIAVGSAIILAAVVYVVLLITCNGGYRHQKLTIGRIITTRYIDVILEKGRLDPTDTKSLPVYARELLEIDVREGEPARKVFERITNKLGRNVPEDFNFSAVDAPP